MGDRLRFYFFVLLGGLSASIVAGRPEGVVYAALGCCAIEMLVAWANKK